MSLHHGPQLSVETETAIAGFFGKYRFLSNFYPAEIEVEGIRYPTTEHAYVAMKTTNLELRQQIARAATPGEVKRQGRALRLRPDWEALRLPAMLWVLSSKFERSDLQPLLLATGSKELIEVNNWGDTYWGVVEGEGSNYLGRLLMLVRSNLQLRIAPQSSLF